MQNIYKNKKYPRRGEIYYITKGNTTSTGSETWSDRHAIIVSSNNINKHSNVVQAVYITTQKKQDSQTHVDISTKNGTRIALCEQIIPVDKSRILEYKGKLSEKQMCEIDKSLAWGLNLSRYISTNHIDNKRVL